MPHKNIGCLPKRSIALAADLEIFFQSRPSFSALSSTPFTIPRATRNQVIPVHLLLRRPESTSQLLKVHGRCNFLPNAQNHYEVSLLSRIQRPPQRLFAPGLLCQLREISHQISRMRQLSSLSQRSRITHLL